MGDSISEQFIKQVSDSIKMVVDLTSRMDERVKYISAKQNETDIKIEKMLESHMLLAAKISVIDEKSENLDQVKSMITEFKQDLSLIEKHGSPTIRKILEEREKRLQIIENEIKNIVQKAQNSETKWNKIIDFLIKILWAVITGYLLYQMGFPEPL